MTILPETKRAPKYTVGLYQTDTFDIFKHAPVYFTRTDASGRFIIRNLKPGSYYIYCFEDRNKNLKCDSQSEKYGFKSTRVTLESVLDSIHLFAVKLDSRAFKFNNYRNISNYGLIRLNKSPRSYRLTEVETNQPITTFWPKGTEITYYPPNQTDSTKVRLMATDSLDQTIDSTFYIKQTKQKPIKESFKIEMTKADYTHPTQEFRVDLNLSHPLISPLPDSLYIFTDTVQYRRIKVSTHQYDTTKGQLTLSARTILPDSIHKKGLKLLLKKGLFINVFKDTANAITKPLSIRTKESMATLIILSSTYEKGLIQLTTDAGTIIQQQNIQTKNIFTNLDPTAVTIRKIMDTNKDNTWTTAHILQQREPEMVYYYYNNQGKRPVPLRANWEVELEPYYQTQYTKRA